MVRVPIVSDVWEGLTGAQDIAQDTWEALQSPTTYLVLSGVLAGAVYIAYYTRERAIADAHEEEE